MVTGIVVNQQPSTPRQLRRKVRAILHNAKNTGLEAQNRENHENFRAYVLGVNRLYFAGKYRAWRSIAGRIAINP
jgi:hypothetical protein